MSIKSSGSRNLFFFPLETSIVVCLLFQCSWSTIPAFGCLQVVERTSQSSESNIPELEDNEIGGPYCGINSLFVCLSSLDMDIEMADLVKKEFVGSYSGSTTRELMNAAESIGADAKSFSNLTINELLRCTNPMVLHVRGGGTSKNFDHWVAFLGFENGLARIVDAPNGLELVETADLLSNWGGSAIAVATKEVDSSFVLGARFDFLLLVVFLISVIGLVFKLQSLFITQHVRHSIHIPLVLAIALVFCIGFHSAQSHGFLKNRQAVAEVNRRYFATDISDIEIDELRIAIQDKTVLVIDSRRAFDFQADSIPGSTNMPINSTLPDRRRTLAGVDKDTQIVVYCQSSRCGYSDSIARFLKFNGYKNTVVYRGGYEQWNIENVTNDGIDK